MVFNSIDFLVFFPLVTFLYFVTNHQFRWLVLLIASCVFYMAFMPVYILILLVTIVVDYYAGILIENALVQHKKKYLIISIFANIGFLFIFKYYNFFVENFNLLLGIQYELPYWKIIFPIGLSFHTFQALSYTFEVYRGNQKAEKHFGIYALYVMFYPQLVAGPIERPQNLLHQFRAKHDFNSRLFIEGLRLMIWGFFKKMVIADRAGIYVDAIYNNPTSFSSLSVLLAIFLFSIQIYCDFSGYSDIAIGAAKTMGFDLMINFRRPYFSSSIKEFWARWHISLSTWFRDYLYIPLGGNRVEQSRIYVNTFIVFCVSGLWHGAKWTFIVWGGIHALLIVSQLFLEKNKLLPKADHVFKKILFQVLCFLLVSFIWVFFRANSLEQVSTIFQQLLSFKSGIKLSVEHQLNVFSSFSLVILICSILFMGIVEFKFSESLTELNLKKNTDFVISTFAIVLILCFGIYAKTSFIYFQF